MSARTFAVLSAMVTVAASLVAAATGVASAASHVAKPSSVSLSSSYASVKSSTKQSLHVQLQASNNPSTPANDALSIDLAKGAQETGESHEWTFPISSSVLQVASSGTGTLKVPLKDVSPFGSVNLTFKPVGKPTTTTCQGALVTKTVKVSLSGVFFFDSKSTGAHQWGTVGSKKTFTFPTTNQITWLYSSAGSENCISTTNPCAAEVFWSAQEGPVSFNGVETGNTAQMFANRTVSLSKPVLSKRSDSNVGTTKGLTVAVDSGGNASLTVLGDSSNVSGSSTISSDSPSQPFPAPCGKGKTQHSEFWSGGYADGSTPLTVAEQVYGALRVGDNDNGSIGQNTVS